MGFYPVCPGYPYYVIGSPQFEDVQLALENGNTFTISAPNNSAANVYIQDAKFNGVPFDQTYINHSEIMKGGRLSFEMDHTPNKEWTVDPEDRPESMTGI